MLAIILSVVMELKDCSRSQPVTYAKQVWISQKRCKIDTNLQWMTNRMSYVLSRIAPLPMTLSDAEGI